MRRAAPIPESNRSLKICLECKTRFASPAWVCPNCGFEPESYLDFLSFAPSLARAGDGWDPAYSERLALHEATNFWFRARNRLIVWSLRRFFPDARKFFEIGCGSGYVLSGVHESLAGLDVSGSDGHCEGLAFARGRCPDVDLCQMDARSIPFDHEFDVIGAFDILEHVDEDTVALSEMHRALRPGGGIVLTVPQHMFLWSVADDFAYHKRRYARRELIDKLERAGFSIDCVSSFNFFLLPLMFISRRRMPKSVEYFDPLTEFYSSRTLNALLEFVLRIENLLISAGVRLPAGGTLFAVARRTD